MSTVDADDTSSSNTSSFVAALVLNGAVFGVQVGAFCVLRPKFPHIYQPRVTKPPPKLVFLLSQRYIYL